MKTRIAPGRALAGAAGLALIAVGLHGVAADVGVTGWAVWFAVPVLVHDAVLVPAVLVAGRLTARLPAPARTPVRAGLAAAGSLTLVALPLVLGHGRRADVPSRLPLPYGRNLAVVLTAIAVAAAVAAAARVHRTRRATPRAHLRDAEPGPAPANAAPPEDRPPDGRPVDDGPSDGQPPGRCPTDGRPPDGRPWNAGPADGRTAPRRPPDGRPPDVRPADGGADGTPDDRGGAR